MHRLNKFCSFFWFLSVLYILTSCSPISKFKSDPKVLGWEKDIREFEKKDSTEKYSGNAILFTGSSSIRLWSTIATDMAPYEVIHRGYGGAKLNDYAYYTKRIVYPHNCKAMVLFVANDITGGDQDKTPDQVAELCKYVVKTVHKKNPATKIFWIEITPTPSRWKAWPKINEANQKIKGLTKTLPNFYFIDSSAEFLGPNGEPRKELFRNDMLHLNTDGYKLWTSIIHKALDEKLK